MSKEEINKFAFDIVNEFFGGFMPNNLAEEGMQCSTDEELYKLIEDMELYYVRMNEVDFDGYVDDIHYAVIKFVKELNAKS